MKRYFWIEAIISVLVTIVSFVLAIIYKEESVITIVSATIAIVGIQNIANILRDSNLNYKIEENIHKIQDNVNLSSEFVPLNEVEKFEQEFCRGDSDNAIVYIISNNLTNDSRQFLDEIISNINRGANYIYIINEEQKGAINKLKSKINKQIKKNININDRFKVYVLTEFFSFCPQKYTLAIYENDLELCAEGLRGFCCAQDNTDKGVYYFEMSFKNTQTLRNRINDIIKDREEIE